MPSSRLIETGVYMLLKIRERFGERVKDLRKQKGMTQERLAEKAGITPAALSQIEKGARVPTIPVLHRIARVLGVSLDYLSGKTEKSELKDLLQQEGIKTFYRGLESLDLEDKQAVMKYIEFLHSKYEDKKKSET